MCAAIKEEGTTTTLFDIKKRPKPLSSGDGRDQPRAQAGLAAAHLKQLMHDKLTEHWHYLTRHGEDMAEVRDWKWKG